MSEQTNTAKMSLYIDRDLKDKLKYISLVKGRPQNKIVLEILKSKIEDLFIECKKENKF